MSIKLYDNLSENASHYNECHQDVKLLLSDVARH